MEGPELGVRRRRVPVPSQVRGVLRHRVRADRPQRPGSRPSGDGHRGPAGRAVAPRSDAGRGRDAPEPAACAGQLYAARPTPGVLTPGTNRKVTVLGVVEVSTGAWVYRAGPPLRGGLHRPAGLASAIQRLLAVERSGGLFVAVSWGFAAWRAGCACTLWVRRSAVNGGGLRSGLLCRF